MKKIILSMTCLIMLSLVSLPLVAAEEERPVESATGSGGDCDNCERPSWNYPLVLLV